MEWFTDPAAWSALLALLTLEIVLGVDNVVFISILANERMTPDPESAYAKA